MIMKSEVAQARPTLSHPMDCSPPGSSAHGIFQARVLEWDAIAFSKYGVKYYYILNRRALRDNKAFLSKQCKEIEENYRMGKTRDLFKKIRNTNGTCHAKMGTIKNTNGMDLTEEEDIQKR